MLFNALITISCFNSKKLVLDSNIQNQLINDKIKECIFTEKVMYIDSIKLGKYQNYFDCLKENSDNQYQHLKELYKVYGYKTLSNHVDLEKTNFWSYIYYYETETEFLKKVLKNIKKHKNLDHYRFAFITDKINVLHNKPQIYGTQIKISESLELSFTTKIKDSAKVNSRREKLGLKPLQKDLDEIIMYRQIRDLQKN